MDAHEVVPYQAHHASFELPARLWDQSTHVFTLGGEEPGEFRVVVSHGDIGPAEAIEDVGHRMLKELGDTLPRFQLRGMKARTLDSARALELGYTWHQNDHFMVQRQVIVLVQGPIPGSRQVMRIAATCLRTFTEEWNAAFDAILDSVRLRHPLAETTGEDAAPEPAAAPVPVPTPAPVEQQAPAAAPATLRTPVWVPAPASASACVFALSERRRMLSVFADRDEACRKTDAREVAQDAWQFFDALGNPLHARFSLPNSGAMAVSWGKAGTYMLEPDAALGLPHLRDCLHQAARFQASRPDLPFTTLDQVQFHLRRTQSF